MLINLGSLVFIESLCFVTLNITISNAIAKRIPRIYLFFNCMFNETISFKSPLLISGEIVPIEEFAASFFSPKRLELTNYFKLTSPLKGNPENKSPMIRSKPASMP
jgi:hypothetical protein